MSALCHQPIDQLLHSVMPRGGHRRVPAAREQLSRGVVTVCKTVRPVLSDHCLSCVLSVTLVYCGQMVGRIKTQVAQLSQRDSATHVLLQYTKLRSVIFEPPFWGLRGNVDASCVRRWKKRGRLPIVIIEHFSQHSQLRNCKVAFLSHPLEDLGERQVLYL